MKFNCCDYLLHELVFAQDTIIPCCCAPRHEYETRFIRNFNGIDFDAEEYITTRNKYVELFKSGSAPDCCKGCSFIKNSEWDESLYIKRIIITNRTKCSCNCIYCSLITTSTQTKQELNTRKTYNIIEVLKNLREKNLINKNCELVIAGGECCEYPNGELEFIIYFALLINCKLEILSSGIIYSKAIENALKTGECVLKISVDSGRKSTYEKIKRVKAYEKVWKNLGDYINVSQNNLLAKVKIKYILLPGINDNIKEAKVFVKKCKEINCKYIELAVEYLWFDKNKDYPIPDSIRRTVKCIKQSGMNISYEGQCIEYLEKI